MNAIAAATTDRFPGVAPRVSRTRFADRPKADESMAHDHNVDARVHTMSAPDGALAEKTCDCAVEAQLDGQSIAEAARRCGISDVRGVKVNITVG